MAAGKCNFKLRTKTSQEQLKSGSEVENRKGTSTKWQDRSLNQEHQEYREVRRAGLRQKTSRRGANGKMVGFSATPSRREYQVEKNTKEVRNQDRNLNTKKTPSQLKR